MLFNEEFVNNNQSDNGLLYVREAGRLYKDANYAIERRDSPTNLVAYILSGTLHVNIYGQHYQIYSNTCFIMPHHKAYKIYSDPDLPCEMIWMNIRGPLFNSGVDTLFDKEHMIVANYNIEDVYTQITVMMMKDEDCNTDIMKAVMTMLIDMGEAALKPKVYESRNVKESRSISMERYIMNRVQYEFSVTDMAEFLHLSTDQLNRIFKKEFGTTPYQYYQQIRMDLVKSLLANTELSIDEISDRFGFSNRNNFSARFKSVVGVSPGKYRRECKGV